MALVHEFIILSQEECKNQIDLYDIRTNRDRLEIHDDIIQYIFDSLKWVPQALTGCSEERKYGLNYYGITEIDRDGAIVLCNIIKAWSDLFKNSPTKLILTGNYSWTEDENISSGAYEVLELDRNEVVEKLDMLINLAKKVQTQDYHIFHFGI